MLHLEQLETRCLLSVVVTEPAESGGLHTLDFDLQPAGSDTVKIIEIFNDGPGTTLDFILSDFNGDSIDYVLSDTSLPFLEDETRTITLTFGPSQSADYEELLTIQDREASGGFVKIFVTGTGIPADLDATGLLINSIVVDGYHFLGTALSLTASLENIGPAQSPAQFTSFYLSSDDQFDPGDLELGKSLMDPVEPGGVIDVGAEITIPDLVVEGEYYVIAVVDGVGEDNHFNDAIASDVLFFSATSFVITDSVDPDDDMEIPFGDVPVGNISNSEIVFLTNITPSTVSITDIQLGTDSFAVGNIGVPQLPPGFVSGQDEFVPVELDTTVETELLNDDDHNWFSFQGQADRLVQIETETNSQFGNPFDTELRIFTQFGDELAWNDDIHNRAGEWDSRVTFVTPYTGLYYIDLDSFINISSGPTDLELRSLDDPINELTLSAEPESRQGILHSQTFSKDFDWYKFEASFGSQIRVTASDDDITDNNTKVNITLYNDLGQELHSQIADGNPFERTLFATGNYYIKLDSEAGFNADYSYQFDLEHLNAGSTGLLDIGSGETGFLPVSFLPQVSGLITDTLTLVSDAGSNGEVALFGTGIPGDLFVQNLDISGLQFPSQVLTGQSLEVNFELNNAGPGAILSEFDTSFYLSTDKLFDPEDVILNISNSDDTAITIGTLGHDQSVFLGTHLDTPLVADGTYYILAVVDPGLLVDEFDETNNVLASEPLVFTDADYILSDSLGDLLDGLLNFGTLSIGRTSLVESISIFNRSETPLSVIDWTLIGKDFYTVADNEPDNGGDDLVIGPGETRRIFAYFEPVSFQDTDAGDFNGQLQLNFSNGDSAQYTLEGKVNGADLIVEESSGAINDDFVEFGKISMTGNDVFENINLLNIGDATLVIENLELGLGEDSPFFIDSALAFDLLPKPDTFFGNVTIGLHTGLVGNFSDTLIIHSSENLNNGIYRVNLSANVVAPQLVVEEDAQVSNDNRISFGNQPLEQLSGTETIRLLNRGTDTLFIDRWVISGDDSSLFATLETSPLAGEEPIKIEPDELLELTTQYLTPKTAGTHNAILTIKHSGGQEHVVRFDGKAGEPDFIVRTDGIEFGDTNEAQVLSLPDTLVGESSRQIFSIFNNSPVDVRIDSIIVSGPGYSVTDPLGADSFVLKQGQSRANLELRFNAFVGLGVGDFNGKLDITGSQNREINLSTTTITPEIDFPLDQDGSGLQFGSVEVGQHASQFLEIQNTGSSPLTISRWVFSNQQFQIHNATVDGVNVPFTGELTIDPIIYEPDGEGTPVVKTPNLLKVEIVYDPDRTDQFTGSEATITLETSDLDILDSLITINIAAESPGVPFEIIANSTVGFFDEDGDLVRVTIKNGSGKIFLNDGKRGHEDINILQIISDDDALASVKISTRGGQTSIGTIISNADLKAILGSHVNINEGIDIDGSLTKLVLNDINEGAEIHISQPSLRPMTIVANHIGDDVVFDLAGDVRSFKAKSFGSVGELKAVNFKKVMITQGNLGAEIIALENIDKIQVKQDLTGDIRANQIRSIRAMNIDGAMIIAREFIGTVQALKDILNSDILSGYDIGLDDIALSGDDNLNFESTHPNRGDIKRIKFGGLFANSNVAAGVVPINATRFLTSGYEGEATSGQGSIGSIKGKFVDGNNGGDSFGFFYAESIKTKLQEEGDFIISPV